MEKLLLTRKEAAQALNISTDTLDRLRESQDIQAVNIGSRVYFSPDELKAFLSGVRSLPLGFAYDFNREEGKR